MAKVELNRKPSSWNNPRKTEVLDLADDRDKIVTSIMHYGYEHDPMDALMNKCNRLESVLIAVLTSMDVPQMRRTLEALGHQIVEDEEMIHKK